jgi:hypothetical protein
MKRFSEREGLKKARMEIQTDSIDDALKSRLWNVLDHFYWGRGRIPNRDKPLWDLISGDVESLFMRMWDSYFKKPVDDLTLSWRRDFPTVKTYFFNCQWYEVYDFIEFVVSQYPNAATNDKSVETFNAVLEEELSAYRFVGGKITKITSKEEIAEVEEALETPFETVQVHVKTALNLMSDRKKPDYRNSIKESISGVEAICKIIANDDKATLGEALDTIERTHKVDFHGALKRALDSLYGYTSSAEGIRHALGLLEEPNLSFEDAKFMLVSCSAFINYLVSKASKAGMKIG